MILMHPISSAAFSPCGRYRYHLERRWGTGPCDLYVMCNPSSAGAEDDDPTIRKCRGFSERADCEGIRVVNLYACVATDPRELASLHLSHRQDVVGPENDAWLERALAEQHHAGGRVIFAWSDAPWRRGLSPLTSRRIEAVTRLAQGLGIEPLCLGTTRRGMPRHPLMVGYAVRAEAWEARAA